MQVHLFSSGRRFAHEDQRKSASSAYNAYAVALKLGRRMSTVLRSYVECSMAHPWLGFAILIKLPFLWTAIPCRHLYHRTAVSPPSALIDMDAADRNQQPNTMAVRADATPLGINLDIRGRRSHSSPLYSSEPMHRTPPQQTPAISLHVPHLT